MLKRLAEEGFVQQRPYRGVFLTPAGRVLAAPLTSPEELPAQDLSAMDGFAVRHDEVSVGQPLTDVADLAGEFLAAQDQPFGKFARNGIGERSLKLRSIGRLPLTHEINDLLERIHVGL